MSVFESLTDSQRHSLNDLIHREAVKRVSQSQWQSKRRMAVDSFRGSQGLRNGHFFLAKLTPEFLSNAIHESGHAVTADNLGIDINNMTVGNDMATIDYDRPELGQDDYRLLTMIAGGWIAERLAKRTDATFYSDEYLIDQIEVEKERKRLGMDQNKFVNTFKGCCLAAGQLLRRNWNSVLRLTNQLIQHRGDAMHSSEIKRAIRGR
jgi:hypothetical protein